MPMPLPENGFPAGHEGMGGKNKSYWPGGVLLWLASLPLQWRRISGWPMPASKTLDMPPNRILQVEKMRSTTS